MTLYRARVNSCKLKAFFFQFFSWARIPSKVLLKLPPTNARPPCLWSRANNVKCPLKLIRQIHACYSILESVFSRALPSVSFENYLSWGCSIDDRMWHPIMDSRAPSTRDSRLPLRQVRGPFCLSHSRISPLHCLCWLARRYWARTSAPATANSNHKIYCISLTSPTFAKRITQFPRTTKN
jgi:hypothetical protein